MEQPQNHAGMVWYTNSYNSVEGILASGTPVQVEIGSDIARQLNQQVQIQYGNFATTPSQPQHIIVTHQPVQEITEEPDETQLVKIQQKPKNRNAALGERVPCKHCGKTFSCNANLRDHMRLHTGERPFSCSECGMAFAQRSNWRLHKRTHTGERPYMCGICGKTFSRSSHLPGHMRVHTGERPFQCESCDNSFASAQALKNHARTHTGEKPFVCEYCATPFTHSSSLSSHKKRCNGVRRKRGRPLGSGRRTFKKNSVGKRGRPKKRGKLIKRGRKKIKLIVEEQKNKCMESDTLTNEELKDKLEIKFESSRTKKSQEINVLEDGQVVEISVEMIEDPTSDKHSTIVARTHEAVKSNDMEGISILPDNGEVIIADDMVCAAVSAAGLTEDSSDLHQEAAVTMAALKHGGMTVIHHQIVQDDSFPQGVSQANTNWYLKPE